MRGYHTYKDIWAAVGGKELLCQREVGNRVNTFPVVVIRDGTVVGHVPKISFVYSFVPTPRWVDCLSCNGVNQ